MLAGIPAAYAGLFEFAGIVGFGCYVLNYTLLTFNVVTNRCIKYFVVNLCAASLVLTSLLVAYNSAAMLIQLFWIFISTIGISIRIRGRRSKSA